MEEVSGFMIPWWLNLGSSLVQGNLSNRLNLHVETSHAISPESLEGRAGPFRYTAIFKFLPQDP